MAFSLEEANRIAELGLPILCVDTCSILDVVRDPCRDTYHAHNAQAGIHLLQEMESGSALIGLVADQVIAEYNFHLADIIEETEKGLKKLRNQIERVDAIAGTFCSLTKTDTAHWNDHVVRATSIVQRWMNCLVQVPQSSNIPNKAYKRVMEGRAPARKGKDSLQDCVVIETYFEAVESLRNAGLTSKIVFISSNVDDYADTARRNLNPGLAPEFSAFNMEYATSFGMAFGLLRR